MASSSPGNAADPSSSSSLLFEGMVLFSPSKPQPQDHPHRHPQPLDEDLFSDLTVLAPSDHQISPNSLPPALEPPADARNNGLTSRHISRKKKRGVRIGYARDPPAVPTTSIRERDAFILRKFAADAHDRDDASSVSSASSSMISASPAESAAVPIPPVMEEVPQSIDVEVVEPVEETVLVEPVKESVPEEVIAIPKHEDQLESPPESHDAELSTVCEEDEYISPTAEVGIPVYNEAFAEKDDAFVLTEGNAELLRAQIAQRLDEIREMAVSVYDKRKKLSRRRRELAVSVNSAAMRYRDLERELEEACEVEDFERAERVSEDLAAVEKEKGGMLSLLREAEVECDLMEARMAEVLQMQIKAEEEGTRLLEQFSKDAAVDADLILKNAKEFCSRELEEWQQSSEELEVKILEIEIEMRLINEARSGLEESMEQLIQDDKREKERLYEKQGELTKELKDLLELVRLKEAEIKDNKLNIQEVEKRISNVINGFNETQSHVSVKYVSLQSALSEVEAERNILSIRKNHIDENLAAAEQKRLKLVELANISGDEAKQCNDMVSLRKGLASPILKSQQDKMKLATTETKISEDIQMLREQVSVTRSSLQELSSNRSSFQEEIASFKQRMAFIDKRIPDLEAEKKVAASARNFKEASRVATEAKTLSSEKESIQLKLAEAVSNLGSMEEEIKKMVDKIQENEGLIVSKEKEAARAGYQRLCLVAASARAERFAALTLDDTEEADALSKEAEAAESKARELLETYGLDAEEMEEVPEEQFSLSLLINLSGKRLALMASSLGLLE